MLNELKQKLEGKKVESHKYGCGIIKEVISTNDIVNPKDKCYGLMRGIKTTIQFDSGEISKWFINIALDCQSLTFDDETTEVIKEYDRILNPVLEVVDVEVVEANYDGNI